MRSNLAQRDLRNELEKLRPTPAKVRSLPESAENAVLSADHLNLLSLIETAYRRARLKQEYLADLSGVKLSTLNGALTGAQNFNVRWLETWPVEFWNEFLPLLKAERAWHGSIVGANKARRAS